MGQEKIKVLLVDDEKDFINMMQYWLEQKGFDVSVIYRGGQVLAKVETEKFDIVFLDLFLPDIHGLDVLRSIKAAGNNIPVVIFSAYGSKENLTQATKLGISGFFAKDKGFNEAVKLIHIALRTHKGLTKPAKGEKE
ncbi:MAG: hypothetical protein DRP78_03950 [Candidatus Omnitrophota bacterium]|nr:MAG: hypothetical protein DRP78_03950 [Candidatus Omnitrophota bacterium]